MVDFLGIGAQKAGTGWLYQNLRRHPQVWFPLVKEVHFFDSVHLRSGGRQRQVKQTIASRLDALDRSLLPEFFKRGEREYLHRLLDKGLLRTDDWYRLLFSAAPSRKKAGEITPRYCAIGATGIAHVKRLLPDVRLIYVVRDPLERSLSSLRMVLERNDVPPARQRRIARHPRFLDRGNYSEHVPLWDAAFGDRVLYLPFGWVKSEPEKLLRRVEDFLGLRGYGHYPRLREVVHATKKVEIAPDAIAALSAAAEPQYAFLRERFGPEFLAATK
jgi:hypothetical protein